MGRTSRRRTAGVLLAGTLTALTAIPATGVAAAVPANVADDNSSLVMVLDSSGSMRDDDGSGDSRITAARKAVGTLVDGLPDNYPTGLRLYGSEEARSCTDTRLAHPVEALDREALKQAVAEVEPKGDTPTALALQKAVADLPDVAEGSIGQRTVVLISDGESNCGAPDPCEVAEKLAEKNVDLRVDTIGFQVKGKARAELRCIAEKGNGSYHEAANANDLARELGRAGKLSAAGYRFKGTRVQGGRRQSDGPTLEPNQQYLDTIGPGETRWYRAELDDVSATDVTTTAVPRPGTEVRYGDGLRMRLSSVDDRRPGCDITARGNFAQSEGALPLTTGLSRVPSHKGDRTCDKAGEFALEVSRHSAAASDTARWPVEIRLGAEQPLKNGVTPGASTTEYGPAGKDAKLPTGAPRDVEGGTGFNDARPLGKGVWRDRLLPSQTRWYKVPVGWGQQLRYHVEFGNEPTKKGSSARSSFVRAQTYNPHRRQVPVSGDFAGRSNYRGDPTAVTMGTVPVSWTNRYEHADRVAPVRMNGDYYIAVTLGAKAAELAENTEIGVLLRVDVLGEEKSGPGHDAPPLRAGDGRDQGNPGDNAQAGAAEDSDGGWSGTTIGLLAGGTGVLLLAGLAVAYAVARRRGAGGVTR